MMGYVAFGISRLNNRVQSIKKHESSKTYEQVAMSGNRDKCKSAIIMVLLGYVRNY